MPLNYTCDQLFNGQVGTIVHEDPQNDDVLYGWDEGPGLLMFNGVGFETTDVVDYIEDFDFSNGVLTLVLTTDGCYEGFFERDGQLFWLDIANECEIWNTKRFNVVDFWAQK